MDLADMPYEMVKTEMVSLSLFIRSAGILTNQYLTSQATGKGRQSVLRSALEAAQDDAEKDELAKWAAASMYSGGADTVRHLSLPETLCDSFLSQTVSVSNTFFLAMALYPEVQAKAQSEIDRVTGTDRLPSFKDRDSLPYLNALVKEVLRWNPVAPLGKG